MYRKQMNLLPAKAAWDGNFKKHRYEKIMLLQPDRRNTFQYFPVWIAERWVAGVERQRAPRLLPTA